MPEIEINIELYCDKCNEGICANGFATRLRGQPAFRVEPCETCLENAENAGYDKGYEAADRKNQ